MIHANMRFAANSVAAAIVGACAFADSARAGSEGACVSSMIKNAGRIAGAQTRVVLDCIDDAANHELSISAQQCVGADLRARVLRAKSRTILDELKRCAPPPPFGHTSAGVINAATVNEVIALAEDVFGDPLDEALFTHGTYSRGAKCQSKATRAIGKLVGAKTKAFRSCAKRRFKSGTVDGPSDLAACADELLSDPKGKIAAARAKLEATVAKSCSDAGVGLAVAFPGLCASVGTTDSAEVATCFDQRTTCRLCRAVSTAHGLFADCDMVDDGDANASCTGSASATTSTTTTSTTTSTTTTTILSCGDAMCNGAETCISCPDDCGACGPIRSVAVIGDSMSKAFNGQSSAICPLDDQEEYNWATSKTHGTEFCEAGPENVSSLAERLECQQGIHVAAPSPNHAESGASILEDFYDQALDAAAWIETAPGRRLVGVFLGHNDICSGEISKVHSSCDEGSDQDPNNHCWTTPAALERELRKGLDELIRVQDLNVRIGSLARVTQLCNHGSKSNCLTFTSCKSLWELVDFGAGVFGSSGICGSITADCDDDARILNAYNRAASYRAVLQSVAAEYGTIAIGEASPVVNVAGEVVGGAIKAVGVEVDYTDAPWWYKLSSEQLGCCDCFHPSPLGQDTFGRLASDGLTCNGSDVCCSETGSAIEKARCSVGDTGGRTFPGVAR